MDEAGEGTLLERSIQAGLLARRGTAGVGFTHALFLEHFAAAALAREPSWDAWLRRVSNDSGRQVIMRIVASLPDPLPALRLLLASDPRAACKAAARVGEVTDAELRKAMLEEPRRLLASRFPSDQAEGLDLLQGSKWAEATKLAVSWYNALLPTEKPKWILEAAELFLSLELESAFPVILWHDGLVAFEFDWYEPSFCRRIDGLSPRFREALQKKAQAEVKATVDENLRRRSVKLLAMLRDPWLVEYLHKRVELRPLTQQEHRALIFLNTHDSIQIYRESVVKWLRHYDEIKQTRKLTHEENFEFSFRTGCGNEDVLMFPHDKLIELANSALKSESRQQVALGRRWAEFVRTEQLIEPYYEASRRYTFSWLGSQRRLIEKLVKDLPFSRIKELYDRYPDGDIRSDIVHVMHKIPGPETIEFLVERLKEPEHQFNAIQSLAMIGAVSAGPAIQQVLRTGDSEIKWMAIEALGALRYSPAVGELIAIVRSLASARNVDEGKEDVGWVAIRSLGQLGGKDAYDALGDVFSCTTHKPEVLKALFQRDEPYGLAVAKKIILQNSDARPLVANAIGSPDFALWQLAHRDSNKHRLRDDVFLDCVIDSVRETVRDKHIKLKNFSLQALASFDLPRADQMLAEVAAGEPAADDREALRQRTDPVLEARRLLAERGHPQYEREMVEREISNIDRMDIVADWHIQDLARWSKSLVRQVLWERVEKGRNIPRSLDLLRWFAEPSDLQRFKRLEDHEDIRVADVAHRYLKDPGRYTLSGAYRP
jgi:hypothetical protein